MTEDVQAQFVELETAIKKAGAEGNIAEVLALAPKLAALKLSVKKAEAEQKSSAAKTAIAGIERGVEQLVKQQAKALEALRQLYDGIGNIVVTIPVAADAVATAVYHGPAAAKRPGGAGGSAGVTSAQYGMRLDDIFQKFATDEERVKLAELQAQHEVDKTFDWSNASFTLKNGVKKRAVKDGLLTAVQS